jgi:hypothetical protein
MLSAHPMSGCPVGWADALMSLLRITSRSRLKRQLCYFCATELPFLPLLLF